MRCDVVVVGAGPAGSMAARHMAEKGLDVVMLEKRQEIGDPVRCAEGVSKTGLRSLTDPDPRWIAAEVRGARLHAPDGTTMVMSEDRSGNEVGYVLERKIFDRGLAMQAALAGARIMVKTRALDLLRRPDGSAGGVKALRFGEVLPIEADLVIGADGVESKVGRWAGIDTSLKPKDIEVCAQFLVYDPAVDDDYCEFFFGNDIAPGGYVWSFPKGRKLANLGLGVLGSRCQPGAPVRLLRQYLERNRPEARVVEMVVGGVPVSGPIERTVADRVMLVGDSARQSDPITGGGILNAMKAGVMAGDVAAVAISDGDLSAAGLMPYEEKWRETIGRQIARHYQLKEFFSRQTDEDLNSLMHSMQSMDMSQMDLRGMLKVLIKLNPKKLWELRNLVV
ncbi:MAG TPA: NAD(P)/FAD-dependent oxidoreductase [Methanotrichaceae archaeon]|nr:NAD(P)/FAD-dependent oxidoreductase [Methanotrichaceae archaeon]HQF17261.1 NAD(P)/FAD-dependent oxidoreductase [Methanotrichaceae archaeon]HQI91834.1 NAD(P)/FAD-dependent oxidoreductase [Methanotrichaceae archaeon]HQJ29164.1 NAD(P)/FAD-dependent oxidoreductase [Methanotrichaceae archaeon]